MSAHGPSSLVRSISRCSFLGAFVVVLALASTADAALLTLNGNILTGATGVNVGGTLYDVEFVDGTCAALFDGCDNAATDFDFTTQSDAAAASQALLDQVFVNVLGGGQFDDTPSLTFGCSNLFSCNAETPFLLQTILGATHVNLAVAQNNAAQFPDGVNITQRQLPADLAADSFAVYAVWTPSEGTPVPEPASLTLLGLGLAGMAGRRWRQRKAS